MEHAKNCGCHLCWEPPVRGGGEKSRYHEEKYQPDQIRDLRVENERLRRELDEARDTNDFDAKRLRRLALLLGLSVPESDETLLGCAGTVLGQACRAVEQLFGKAKSDGRCAEGWVLMPKEPTEEIRVAMAKARCEFDGDQGCDSLMKVQYRAAIAAGSVPPNA